MSFSDSVKAALAVLIVASCGTDKRYLANSGTYNALSNCSDAKSQAGNLDLTQVTEYFGDKIVTYSLDDGKPYGLPQNNIKAKDDVLTSEDDNRSCKAPLIEGVAEINFLCRDRSGQSVCSVRLIKQ